MKIAQINAVYGIGSTGRTTKELAESLACNGHECFVGYSISNVSYQKEGVTLYQIGNALDHKAHALFSRLFGLQAYFSSKATKNLIKELEIFKPDVVHLRNLHANYINLPLLLKWLGKNSIPTVISLHDCWIFTGKCTHYTVQNCYKWQTGCSACSQLKKDNNSWLFDRTNKLWKDRKSLFEKIDNLAVVGVSNWITDQAKSSTLKSAKIIKRIYNWIDLKTFYPRECEKSDNFSVLLISAGWSKNSTKTQDMLALANGLNENMQIILAGSVESDIELPKNVKPIGYVNSTEDLAKLYSQVDVYVHLSQEDTFGKVIAEALACGTPAIVYNSTACPELVGNGCGYVVKPRDINAVSNAVNEVYKNGKEKYSANCVEFAKSNFEKDYLIKETLSLYNELLRG
ncbi:MAG: glycosyltransferase [Clostridia bacterium]|nr:glycosyltransferase [Clostridia bacterium]